MSAKMKSMKKLINAEGCTESIENHLSVAATMEAGSRSPLPLSKQQLSDFEINSASSTSLHGFFSSSDSVNSNTHSITLKQKHTHTKTPFKPPRNSSKSYTILNSSVDHSNNCQINSEKSHFKNYEPVSITTLDPNKNIGSTVILKPLSPGPLRSRNKPPDLPLRNDQKPELNYECITPITDAWKFLGIGVVNHTERNSTENSEDQSAKTFSTHKIPPKIIDIDFGEKSCNNSAHNDDSYDRLNFLFPNNQSSNGYKTIIATSYSNRSKTPAPNDYELIGGDLCTFPECATAAKSDLNYGITESASKKNSPKDVSTDDALRLDSVDSIYQRSFNGINYSTVTSKRV